MLQGNYELNLIDWTIQGIQWLCLLDLCQPRVLMVDSVIFWLVADGMAAVKNHYGLEAMALKNNGRQGL